MALWAQPQYLLSRVSVGTAGNDWGEAVTPSGDMIFSSVNEMKDVNGDAVTRIYILEQGAATPKMLFEKESKDVPYMGAPYVTPDGTEMFFAMSGKTKVVESSGLFKASKVFYPLQIAISKRNADGTWSAPELFVHNLEQYSSGDPWLSNDGNYLYFASDRPGGMGGLDLWRSRREGGSWGAPENLTEINTEVDERSPRFDVNGGFYFASNRSGGAGGLDLYSCAIINDGHFATPVRMASPLNSAGDDFAIMFTAENKGYISSSRTGTDAIYEFEKISMEIATRITVVDKKGNAIPGAQAYFMSEQACDSKILTTAGNGDAVANLEPDAPYTLLVYKEDYLPKKFSGEKSQAYNNRTVTLEEVPICMCDTDPCLPTTEEGKRVIMKNILFDLDKWNIRPDAAKEVDKLAAYMLENPESEVEVSAYTDCRASEAYNMALSQRRANSVKAYLVKKGIAARRIKAKGYGETNLLNRCDCSRNIDCTEAEHQINRRAEYMMTK